MPGEKPGILASADAAEKQETVGPGVAHKSGVGEVVVVHCLALRRRLGKVVGGDGGIDRVGLAARIRQRNLFSRDGRLRSIRIGNRRLRDVRSRIGLAEEEPR